MEMEKARGGGWGGLEGLSWGWVEGCLGYLPGSGRL